MRLCHIVPSLEDRHGGPSKSVRALANSMARLGKNTELLTTADAAAAPLRAENDDANLLVFPREAPRWLCRSPGLHAHLEKTVHDCVHHHSLWLLTLRYAHRAAERHATRLIISPRGMMSGWAYRHRRWRKRIAELVVHPGAFAAASGWHATSPEEADDIRRLGFRQPVCVAPNGVEVPAPAALAVARQHWLEFHPPLAGRRIALFYSRFHRKKRLRELIDLWLSAARGEWLLVIAGLPEEFSVAEINGWIAAAGAQNRIVAFDGTGHPPPFALASLFLLPSQSENFGLVIAEALAAGVPALVTDATPWSGLLGKNAGWCVPWPEYGASLDRALKLDAAALEKMGGEGRRWMSADFTWERSARLLLEFYHHLLNG